MITENKKIIPLVSNTMFKEIFGKEENKEMLAYLISEYFNIEYNFVLENIEHQNTSQNIDNKNDYKYDVDIILSLNNEVIINIEMNKRFWIGLENRNLAYISKIYSSQYERGKGKEQFRTSKKHIQINFNNYNYPRDREISINRLKDIETNEELTDIIEIHHVNLEVIERRCYNKKEEELTAIEKIVRCLKAEDIKEIEKQVGERMKSILDKVMELSNDERLVGLYNKEELAEQREYGMKLLGIEEGMQKGIEQTKEQVVFNMLKKNIDIGTISEITELSIDEIKEISNNK